MWFKTTLMNMLITKAKLLYIIAIDRSWEAVICLINNTPHVPLPLIHKVQASTSIASPHLCWLASLVKDESVSYFYKYKKCWHKRHTALLNINISQPVAWLPLQVSKIILLFKFGANITRGGGYIKLKINQHSNNIPM